MIDKTTVPSKQDVGDLIKPYNFKEGSSRSIDVRECSYPENGGYLFTCMWFSFIIDEQYIPLIIDECCYNIRKHDGINMDNSDNRIRVEFELIDQSNMVKIRIFGNKYETIIPIILSMTMPKNIIHGDTIHNFDRYTVFVEEVLVEIYNCLER